MVGDDGQIGPHGDTRWFSDVKVGEKHCARKAVGKAVFDLFTDVVVLTDCPRCKGDKPYLNLLLRLRDLDITQSDFHRLLKRTKYELSQTERLKFSDAVRLVKTNSKKDAYNIRKASELSKSIGKPLFQLSSHFSTNYSKTAPDEEADNLPKNIHLLEGMKVMVLRNLWQNVGVVNGALGTLVEIIYKQGQAPPHLPFCILVQLSPTTYSGPSCHPQIPNCVPICPFPVQWYAKGQLHQRTQLPVVMAWAITIDKSQGLTLEHIVVDLEGRRNEPALPFVACSRTGKESNLMFDIKPGTFTYELFTRLKRSRNLKARLKSDERLLKLAQKTREKYRDILQ